MTTRLIGLYSPAPQSGKSTVASILLSEHYFQSVSFALPLKRMATVLLKELGYSDADATRFLYEDKEDKIPEINTTARHILQTLGTEFGRNCVHPQVWVMCAEKRIREFQLLGRSVVIDDVRFPNEADLIRSLGGELWHIERPTAELTTSHASEGSLADYSFDRYLLNDSSLSDLVSKTESLVCPPAQVA